MTKDIISIDKNEWETEVNLKVPSFQNFGARMGTLERESFDAMIGGFAARGKAAPDEANAAEPPTPDISAMLAGLAGKQLEALKSTIPPEQYAQMADVVAQMENMDWDLEDEVAECEEKDYECFNHDLQALRIVCPAESGWDAAAEARLNRFLGEWPALRPLVLQAVCDHYGELHQAGALFDDDPLLTPDPGSPEIVEDRFRITAIYLREDGLIGLSGDCTWDEEHALGVLLEDGKVIDCGQADVAFDER